MRTTKIQVVEDRATGETGMLLKGIRLLDTPMVTFDGFGIAHDIIDHQNGLKAIGSIADELEALGGIWFSRGQFGDIRRNSRFNPHEALGGDISNLGLIYHNGVGLRTPIKFTHSTDHDYDFDEIIELGMRDLKRELEYEDEGIDQNKLDYFAKMAKHLMRSGYRKARIRFDDNPNFANRQFWNIADAVDRGKGNVEFEGQEFALQYGNGEARFYEVESYDW